MKISQFILLFFLSYCTSAQCKNGESTKFIQSVRTLSPNSQEKQERVFTTFEIMLCKEEATEKLTITKKSVRQFISIDAIDESPAQEFTIDTRSAIPTEERQKSIYENYVSQLNSPIRVTYKPQEKTAEIKETAVFKADYFIGFQPILHPVPILSTIQFEDVAAERWKNTVEVAGVGQYRNSFEEISKNDSTKTIFFKGELSPPSKKEKQTKSAFTPILQHSYSGTCTYHLQTGIIREMNYTFTAEEAIQIGEPSRPFVTQVSYYERVELQNIQP